MPQHFTRSFHPKSKTTHTRTHKHTLFSPLPPCALAQAYVCVHKCPMFFYTLHGIMWNFPVGLYTEIATSVWRPYIHLMLSVSFTSLFLFSLLFFTIIFSLMGFLDCCVHTRYAWCTHRYSLVIRRIYNFTEQSEKEKRKWGYMLLQLNAEKARNELFIK